MKNDGAEISISVPKNKKILIYKNNVFLETSSMIHIFNFTEVIY